MLDARVDVEGLPPCSVTVRHHGGQGAMTLAQLRGPLAELAAGLSAPEWIYFELKPTRAMDISTVARRRTAVLDCVAVGGQRNSSGFDPFTLGWLRYLAFFNHALIPEVVDHIQALFTGTDSKVWLCAPEYVALAHDVHWLARLLQRLISEQPPGMALRIGVDEPCDWPIRGRQRSFLDLGLGVHPRVADLVTRAHCTNFGRRRQNSVPMT